MCNVLNNVNLGMSKPRIKQVVFKPYSQQQGMLLPPSLDELIGKHHPVRVVNKVLDSINLDPLLDQYKGGGTSSYHPKMLLKVLVFAYIGNIYSSRKIEAALQENIHFMWLSGMSRPDHHTINRFRSERLKTVLADVFTQVVQLLAAEGQLSIKDIYTDGTKIEADANRYTFVWGKAIKTNKEKMKEQIKALLDYARKVAAAEMEEPDPTDFEKIDADKVERTIEKINAVLKDKQISKDVKQKLNYARKTWPATLRKYEEQQKLMGPHRNSYSKTDKDATFMRMKEDHMNNGQLKAAYNVQLSSNNQYVVNYSLHQSAGDTGTLIEHLQTYRERYKQKPQSVTADAGYGSEENYQHLESEDIAAFVKHSRFDRQQQEQFKTKNAFDASNLFYNEAQDCYYCPMGQPMNNIGMYEKKTTNGYKQQITRYRAVSCNNCPLRGACHKSKDTRVIEVNRNLNRLRAKANENLLSELGIAHRKRRCADIEPVFANIKHNHGFKRFMLRGIEKVTIETGLLVLAHNLRKKNA